LLVRAEVSDEAGLAVVQSIVGAALIIATNRGAGVAVQAWG